MLAAWNRATLSRWWPCSQWQARPCSWCAPVWRRNGCTGVASPAGDASGGRGADDSPRVNVRPLTTVPRARPEETAGEILAGLRAGSFESAVDVAVLDEGRLLGFVPIERLLAALLQRGQTDWSSRR